MASSIYNSENVNKDIKFLSTHIGGNNDGTKQTFENQLDIINNVESKNKIKYQESINIQSNESTVIGEKNISNHLVVPKEYDLYIEYLNKKNLDSSNTRSIQKYYYVNVDNTLELNNVNENYQKLNTNPLVIANDSNILRVNIPNHDFTIGDKITLQGISLYTIVYDSITFTFTNGSNQVLINIPYDFNYIYNSYNILYDFSGITTSTNMFNNIPTNVLNQTQTMYIYNNQLAFNIPLTFYSDSINTSLTTSAKITYNNIANIPINIINAFTPIGKTNLNEYQIVSNVGKHYIEISLQIPFSLKEDTLVFGGNDIQVGKVIIPQNTNIDEVKGLSISINNINDYQYTYNFNQKIENIISIKLLSSELSMPLQNQNKIIINESNNKLYWKNITDTNEYSISIPYGYYDYTTLSQTITDLVSKIPRTPYPNLFPFNIIKTIFDSSINSYTFTSNSKYILPKCLTNLITNTNSYVITIQQMNHTLKIGDIIEISGSIDYYIISKEDINGIHIITNAYANFYEITLININTIPDIGNTYGGYKINITESNYIELLFSKQNTVGSILQFKNTGSSASISKFSDTINNNQQYLYSEPSNIINTNVTDLNFPYILLYCQYLNKCINPYDKNYFYKFLIDNSSTSENNILYNSHVDTPIYFDQPLDYLENLKLIFTTPKGQPISIQTFKYSFTLEIITITNQLENTNLNINIGKI
jgi:hypothetical protein